MNDAARPSDAAQARIDDDLAGGRPGRTDLSGRTLGDFELVRRLGEGGMGQVYLARQLSLKRQVAVKVLKAEVAASESSLRRFRQEAEAVARINHANIVQVYAIGESDGLHYMALEYVEGKNLRDYLSRKGPPDLPIALNIIRQVALALQRASELGFVHRDIKPENILVTRKTEVKVADFGLSRCFAPEAEPLSLTQSGVAMGTPLYMAPEQVQAGAIDPRTDVYSFGVTCYHLLAGHPPFQGSTAFEVALQHVQAEPPPLAKARPDLPADLCAMVHRMMAKRPDDRYQTARELLRDLARVREAIGTGTTAVASPPAPTSDTGRPAASSSLTLPVVELPRNRHGLGKWLPAFAALLAAAGLGAGLHAWRTGRASKAAVVSQTEAPPNASERFAEAEQALRKRIDDKERTLDAAVDDVLELTMLYVRRAQEIPDPTEQAAVFNAAMAMLSRVTERGPFRDAAWAFKGGESALKYHNFMVVEFGKGIVLAYKDQPDQSNKHFLEVLDEKHLPQKAKGLTAHPYDQFFLHHRRWKKEVADAIRRNAINLRGQPLNPVLERYESYAPKQAAADKKG